MDTSELVFKVLSSTATEEEVALVEEWKNHHIRNASEFDALRMFWNNNSSNKADNFDAGLEKIKSEIAADSARRRKLKRTARFIAIAVTGVALFFCIDNITRYTSKKLIKYDHTQMAQVMATIEEQYNVSIQLPSHLQTCTYSGSFYNHSLQSSLYWISKSMNWSIVKINEKEFKIEGQGCMQDNRTGKMKR